jgi:NADH dehydrogenase
MTITIVGSGFGGVKTALLLAKNKKNKITLITNNPDFQYYPALYGTATGYSHLQAWVPLDMIFKNISNVTIVIDTITKIDKAAKRLSGESGLKYDYRTLVLSLGTVTTYFGIEGLDHYAFGIKSAAEIKRLKEHLYTEFAKERELDKHYVVVGAGPTGVELSAALVTYLDNLRTHYKLKRQKIRIDLVEAAPRILPRMSESASRKVEARLKKLGINVETAKTVQSETADTLMVSGEPIKSHTVIWTSGVANNPFYAANEASFSFAKNGKVVVDDYMRTDKDIYVIGDNAATPYSGLAQTALHDAHFVARAIKDFQRGVTPHAYKPKTPPVVIPVGENWAIFEWKFIKLSGWPASLIRMAADFVGYSDILPFAHAFTIWRSQHVKDATYYGPSDTK